MGALYSLFALASLVFCGWLLYLLCRPFVGVRPRIGAPLLVLLMGGALSMVIWIGDPNLLFTFPIFVGLFMLATTGERLGRLTVSFIFFCLTMSLAAIFDTYISYGFRDEYMLYDVVARLARLVVVVAVYLGYRHFLPKEPVALSRPLWSLVFALSLMPLSALASTVLLTAPRYASAEVATISLRLGLGILPFVLLTSLVLIGAIIVLMRQERLEQEHALAAQRDIYYEGIRQQDQQLRELRHDLRNHVTTVSGLLALGKATEASAYLDELREGDALSAPRHFCANETANVVLAAKAESFTQAGIAFDVSAQLPEDLPIAASDLCALLGNALDNAREGALGIPDATVRCRCRYDKGLFMLAVDNPSRGDHNADLSTTKTDKQHHGYGLASMKAVASRYHGSLETSVDDAGFHLLVCLSPDAGA